ncbi:MBL fold metallo-hydrolase [Natronosporangium hydrolyticum]|uniref:MBL fold metallo-hydrolase n=1 Tax=Natronosporangium hydrolyticum TaxID=2811111 RepID=A0A895YFI0_9ACTN|nr:MBL fold metallo-hydrolase [Natronosporangium hydrolyticum]QSB13296.1 MBL fold metallo-hydrolase [Natronosporangium hydrolyticum]
MVDFSGGPVAGDLDVRWIHGSRSKADSADPLLQVHRYDEHTYILRQSMTVSHEAPFLYLLFGNDRVLLLDTGATKDPATFPLRATVDELVSAWLASHPRADYALVVAHTHAHGDHIAGDEQFADRPLTTVVPSDLDSVQSFFGIADWPEQVVSFDLGGRVLDLVGAPGHHPTSLAFFDPWTGFLLTGDSVYPGRLYGFDMPAFVASLDRLVEFAEARPVTHVMGCHIEMSRMPGRDYPLGTKYQPDEPPLQMTMAQLRTVRDAARAAEAKPGVYVHDDFVIASGMGIRSILRLLVRSFGQRLGVRRASLGEKAAQA